MAVGEMSRDRTATDAEVSAMLRVLLAQLAPMMALLSKMRDGTDV